MHFVGTFRQIGTLLARVLTSFCAIADRDEME